MKKLYILLLLGCVLSACDRVTDLQPRINPNEAIPSVAVNAIKTEFPEATQIRFSTLEKDKLWESNFQVRVDQMSAVVNNLGKISETYRVANSIQLPDNAKNYITTNFPGAVVKNICQQMNPDGSIIGYKVIATLAEGKDIVVVFDKTGTFIMVATNDKMGPGGGGPPRFYFIEKQDLPEIIRSYLDNKHKDYTLVKAAVVLQGGGKLYSVVITKDLTTFEYLFDEKGNVLRTGTFGVHAPLNRLEYKVVASSEIPQRVREYLNIQFSAWTYENGITYAQNGTLLGYYILVTALNKQFSIQFDADGFFIRGQQVCGPAGASSNKYEIKSIQPKDLPAAISSFLTNRHQEFTYLQTSLITDRDKKIYWVAILKDNSIYNYTFDDKGNPLTLVENILKLNMSKVLEKGMAEEDIPENIKQYINTVYAGWVFQMGLMNFADNKLFSYILVIKVNGDFYVLSFDANGNFVTARKA
ncbi:PepSY-like domain-containing protein [Emticicia sp. 17c]|uniref:PepSY-like domain-containing protein n=1 Tax=Emticicia sp. 17c TaxID=3127704 RepID=UPI00301D2DDA